MFFAAIQEICKVGNQLLSTEKKTDSKNSDYGYLATVVWGTAPTHLVEKLLAGRRAAFPVPFMVYNMVSVYSLGG